MSSARPEPRILVLGSVTWETALTPTPKSDPVAGGSPGTSTVVTPTPGLDKFVRYTEWVGAPTVRRLICNALVEVDSKLVDEAYRSACRRQLAAIARRISVNDPDDAPSRTRARFRAECGEVTAVFERFPQRSVVEGKPGKPVILRVRRTYYVPEAAVGSMMEQHVQQCFLRWEKLNQGDASKKPQIIVIYDRDPRVRSILRRVRGSSTPPNRATRVLVVAMMEDVDESLASAVRSHFQADPANTIILLTVDALRRRGLNIIEYGSIEQTVRDTVRYLQHSPLKNIMESCGHLLLVFEETGVIYVRRDDTRWRGSIHFCPNFDRVAQMDRQRYGHAPGRAEIALAAVVKQVDAEIEAGTRLASNLEPAIRLAVSGYNLHFSEGFKDDPFRALEAALDQDRRRKLKVLVEDPDIKNRQREFFIASLEFPIDENVKTWSRLSNLIPRTMPAEDRRIKLHRIVTHGVDQAFRRQPDPPSGGSWFPMAPIGCPYVEIGKIKTVDLTEISGFVDLAKLIRKYLWDVGWTTPLSIAVFGPPGSGKNFAVKQLLKAVRPAAKEEPELTYNLAQFDSVALLTEAFHQVQDRALASAEVPLVIFDEFDCKFGTEALGWLKYFLSPMQDGLFRGGSSDYRIGRAIFLFAGGTSREWDEFRGHVNDKSTENAKLPDFISRLHGHLDIVDINPPAKKRENRDQETLRLVRRAMLLRSVLLADAKPIVFERPHAEDVVAVHERVIDAFLNAGRYTHGVRSMQTVIRMSRWIRGELLPASLPSPKQLAMHITKFEGGSDVMDRLQETEQRTGLNRSKSRLGRRRSTRHAQGKPRT
jgi:hypothetical protein